VPLFTAGRSAPESSTLTTRLPNCYKQTRKLKKIIFFNAIPKTFKDVIITLRGSAFQTLITLSTSFVCCGGVVFCVFAGGGSAMRGSRDRRHDDAYATESSQNLRRMIFTAYTRRPYTCEIIPVISQYETVITGINCMVTELNNKHFTRQIFWKSLFDWLSLTWPFASITSWGWRLFEHRYFTRYVATQLRCGGIFK